MKISTMGSGYVGLVTGAIFSEWGNEVICADVNESKIEKLKRGEIPIFEPGLKEIIDRNRVSGKLRFTTNNQEAVEHADVIFICVGTPAEERVKSRDQYLKRANLTYVGKVARDIAMYMDRPKIVVDKSTVPVKTGEHVEKTIKRYLPKDMPFWIVSNPEFLREGQAVKDCLDPDRIVIGCNREEPFKVMRELYSRFPERIIETNIWSAELGKLAANGFLALSISYANILARLCDKTGADVTEVAKIMRADRRIGPRAFLNSGIGYGGSCFPKDVAALYNLFAEEGLDSRLLKEVMVVNDTQIEYFTQKIREEVWTIGDKTFSVLGLAFKDDTDDVRESRGLEVIKELCRMGAPKIKVYDQYAQKTAKEELERMGEKDRFDYNGMLTYCNSIDDVCSDTDVLIVASESKEFKEIKPDYLKQKMTNGEKNRPSWVFEGRHTFDPKEMIKEGFIYYSIGRPTDKI